MSLIVDPNKKNELMRNNFMLSRPIFKGKYLLKAVMGNFNTTEKHLTDLLELLNY